MPGRTGEDEAGRGRLLLLQYYVKQIGRLAQRNVVMFTSKITASCPRGPSAAGVTVVLGRKAPCEQWFVRCRKSREVSCARWVARLPAWAQVGASHPSFPSAAGFVLPEGGGRAHALLAVPDGYFDGVILMIYCCCLHSGL